MAEIAPAHNKSTDDTAADVEKIPSVDDTNATELVKSSPKHVDEAFIAFQGHEDIVVDEATDKRLLRRIDRRILPIMCIIYGMYVIVYGE